MKVQYARYVDRVLQDYEDSEQFAEKPVPSEEQAPVCGDCEQGPGRCVCN